MRRAKRVPFLPRKVCLTRSLGMTMQTAAPISTRSARTAILRSRFLFRAPRSQPKAKAFCSWACTAKRRIGAIWLFSTRKISRTSHWPPFTSPIGCRMVFTATGWRDYRWSSVSGRLISTTICIRGGPSLGLLESLPRSRMAFLFVMRARHQSLENVTEDAAFLQWHFCSFLQRSYWALTYKYDS